MLYLQHCASTICPMMREACLRLAVWRVGERMDRSCLMASAWRGGHRADRAGAPDARRQAIQLAQSQGSRDVCYPFKYPVLACQSQHRPGWRDGFLVKEETERAMFQRHRIANP